MALLDISGLTSGYGVVPVLHDFDLSVEVGELVAIIGANGAGKTTFMRTLSGLIRPMSGTIQLDGQPLTSRSPAQIAAAGLAHVPENRRVFPKDPIEENLRLGGWVQRKNPEVVREGLEKVYERFPILGERRKALAGSLSGGQQQMLAIGMAMMAKPRLLLLDEPSLGLAPLLVEAIFTEIQKLKDDGVTILLVEQFASEALRIADRGVVLHLGSVAARGTSAELRANADFVSAYLG